MNAVADKLDEARALIERGWTRGSYARTERGRPIGYEEQGAVCWCSVGALFRVAQGDDLKSAYDALAEVTHEPHVVMWNDTPGRTQAEVIDAFKRAAELARAGDQ